MASEPGLMRRGPLEAAAGALTAVSSEAVRIEVLPLRTVLNLRGGASGDFAAAVAAVFGVVPPLEPNRWHGTDDRAAVWLGPDEWLLLAPAGESRQLEQAVRSARPGDPWLSVTDVSHSYAALRLSGPRSAELLAGGCALDLHSSAFGPGACAQSTLARAPVWLRKLHDDGSIEVSVRNSFAAYLTRWLAENAQTLLTSVTRISR